MLRSGDARGESAMKKLKILHIGNIANNAYVNAKLLRERGHECHVACNDFYHFAGCPEWIDSTVPIDRGAITEPYFPNFWKLGAHKPLTPRWFAQGPQASVLNYLFLLNQTNDRLTEIAWNVLQYQKFKIIYRRDTLASQEIWNIQKLDAALSEMEIAPESVADVVKGVPSDTARYLIYDWNRRVSPDASNVSMPSFPMESALLQDYALHDVAIRALLDADFGGSYLNAINLTLYQAEGVPERAGRLSRHKGSEAFHFYLDQWHQLCGFYDVVMAYGHSSIIPYLAGVSNFVAYEHGTLRDLPFDGTMQGELIKASYEEATAVFITNTDYIDQKRQLKIAPDRLHCLPHAFDERTLRDYIATNPPSSPDVVTFFAPARQDWVKKVSILTKNNHFVVHAARNLRDRACCGFKVIFIEWGDDVEATKALIAEQGLNDVFEWCSPLAKQQLWTAYASAHAVIDQFLFPSISGVSFEALALGRRVITYDNGVANRKAFGEQPPLLSAHDIDTVTKAMRAVIDDPDDKAGVGRASWEWVDRCHSAKRIVDIQEAVFAKL